MANTSSARMGSTSPSVNNGIGGILPLPAPIGMGEGKEEESKEEHDYFPSSHQEEELGSEDNTDQSYGDLFDEQFFGSNEEGDRLEENQELFPVQGVSPPVEDFEFLYNSFGLL